MSGPKPYGPSAGYHPAPDQSYGGAAAGGYDYGPQGPPPQHAGYDSDTGYPVPPGFVPPSRAPPPRSDHFSGPPRQEYNEDHWDERSHYDRGYDSAPPSGYGQARDGYDDRPYAPSDPPGHDGNAITPYSDERAEAEDRRAWEEQQRRRYAQPPPPPPADYGRRDRYRDDRGGRDDDSYYDYRRDDDRDRYAYSDSRSSLDTRDRRDDRRDDKRRRESRSSPTKTGKDFFGGKEGQRGLSAQILGGAVGGLAGHELGGSVLKTLGGVVVGAMGAKVLENEAEKRGSKKEKAMKNAAPFKDDAIRDRRSSYPSRPPPPRDGRRDYPRSRSRTRSRPGASRRRGSESDYSSDYESRSPPLRR